MNENPFDETLLSLSGNIPASAWNNVSCTVPLFYTVTTDHFDFIKEAAHKGNLVSVKLVWSFRHWKWMYKYQFRLINFSTQTV